MGILNRWIESLDYEFRILESCSRFQSPLSTCSRCIDSCSEKALTNVDGIPIIDNDKCTECGSCIAACPVQAVEGFLPRRVIIQNKLVVTEEHPPSIKELLGIYRKGVKTIIYEQKAWNKEWQETVAKACDMLEKINESPFSVQCIKIEMEEKVTRREIFSLWKKEALSTMKHMTPAKWRFNQKELDLSIFYPNYQFTHISLNTSKCTACKACQMLCKRNCLQITETDFTISAQRCTECLLCQDICPEKAITVEERIQPSVEVVHPLYTKECKTCKSKYQTLSINDDKCVMCKKREAFGTFLK